ncbi:MAG: cytochrome-c peroxidase [Halioglobus sp.]
MQTKTTMLWLLAYTVLIVESTSAAPTLAALAPQPIQTEFRLSNQCPPSFEKSATGGCELRTLYEFYDSVQDRGVGGLQTSLPTHRDSFTPEQIDLGRYLFFDPVLSADGTISCASCHQPGKGFGDGLPTSVGIGGQAVTRAAPTLWNVAFLDTFFWDARARSLEEQAQGPLYAAHEMGNTPGGMLNALNGIDTYRALFSLAYERNDQELISLDEVYLALAAFQASLISLNSRYDRYVHGYHEALTPNEIEGMNIFRSFVARCSECHMPPLFTTGQIAVIGAPEPEGRPLDVGAEKTFDTPRLKAGFKVPTLRNIGVTAPYMHSGLFDNLRDNVAFYNGGRGHAVPPGVDLELHWHISSPDLREDELDRLVDFLHTLTDESLKPKTPETLPSGLPLVHITPAASSQSPRAAQLLKHKIYQE